MLLIGRKAICKYLGVTWRTVVNRKNKGHLPIRHLPDRNKPYLDTEEYEMWVKIYNNLLEEYRAQEEKPFR